jgi:hypothetical protein
MKILKHKRDDLCRERNVYSRKYGDLYIYPCFINVIISRGSDGTAEKKRRNLCTILVEKQLGRTDDWDLLCKRR